MQQYIEIIQQILDQGEERGDRTNTGTLSVFGVQKKFDLSEGFPLSKVRRLFFKGVAEELFWFLSGSVDMADLHPCVHPWWKGNAFEDGTIGPSYGFLWRGGLWKDGLDPQMQGRWPDQLEDLLDNLKGKPESRRHNVSLWDPRCIPHMALPCCHGNIIQFYVRGSHLDMSTYQRSADVFLGLPNNFASYGLLLHMVAHYLELEPGVMTYNVGDAHIYSNHMAQCKEQVRRWERRDSNGCDALPKLRIKPKPGSMKPQDFHLHDLSLEGYEDAQGPLKGVIAL